MDTGPRDRANGRDPERGRETDYRMRIFVAGATGALGVPLVRHLLGQGHEVAGFARTRRRVRTIEALGAHTIVGDALDASSVRSAIMSCMPDVVVHALTGIPAHGPLRPRDLVATNELRRTATRNLISAALAAGAQRLVVESMVFVYGFGNLGTKPITEEHPMTRFTPYRGLQPALSALREEESQVEEAGRTGRIDSVILRFGGFYGPGAGTDVMARLLRRRWLPVPKRARGMGVPWIHVEDAASAMAAATTHDGRLHATYNVVDDEPARFRDFAEHLARTVGAPPPLSVPMWVMRVVAPLMAAAWLDTTLFVSNAKIKRELGWRPRFLSYRDGLSDFTRRREFQER